MVLFPFYGFGPVVFLFRCTNLSTAPGPCALRWPWLCCKAGSGGTALRQLCTVAAGPASRCALLICSPVPRNPGCGPATVHGVCPTLQCICNAQGLNMAVNAFLKYSLGENFSAPLLGISEMPKPETRLTLDFSSLLGAALCLSKHVQQPVSDVPSVGTPKAAVWVRGLLCSSCLPPCLACLSACRRSCLCHGCCGPVHSRLQAGCATLPVYWVAADTMHCVSQAPFSSRG